MADRNKFEEMLERLINEDREGAEELFHEIVVEKSRDIYAGLLESEAEDDEVDEATDEEVDESDDDLEESDDEEVDESDDELEEGFDLDEFEVEADPMGGDATDDMVGDLDGDDEEGDDEEGDDEEGDDEEGDMEDRVMDLEDALDELKAEFEAMMGGAGDDHEEPDADQMGGMSDMDADNEEEPEEESFQATITPMTAGETMREYVEKVASGHGAEKKSSGDNGANTKSAVAGPNNMGGTTANLRGGEAKSGNHAGLGGNKPKDMNTKNVNVPGAKGATKMSATKGHGAEKKGSGDNGVNTKPIIGKK